MLDAKGHLDTPHLPRSRGSAPHDCTESEREGGKLVPVHHRLCGRRAVGRKSHHQLGVPSWEGGQRRRPGSGKPLEQSGQLGRQVRVLPRDDRPAAGDESMQLRQIDGRRARSGNVQDHRLGALGERYLRCTDPLDRDGAGGGIPASQGDEIGEHRQGALFVVVEEERDRNLGTAVADQASVGRLDLGGEGNHGRQDPSPVQGSERSWESLRVIVRQGQRCGQDRIC